MFVEAKDQESGQAVKRLDGLLSARVCMDQCLAVMRLRTIDQLDDNGLERPPISIDEEINRYFANNDLGLY